MKMGDDNLLSNTVTSILINGIMNAPLKGEKITFFIKVLFFKEISEDLECEKYGKVNEIFMLGKMLKKMMLLEWKIFMFFLIVLMMQKCQKKFICRRFNHRLVRIIYFEEEKFDKKILKIMKKVIIILKVIIKKNKINESWIVGNENNGIDIVNVNNKIFLQ